MPVERNVSALSVVRAIFSELRQVDKNFSQHSPTARFIMSELRYHQLSQRVLCKAPNEMQHLATTYKDYLKSTRRLLELEKLYQGGERTVAESANLVGLALPENK